MRKISRNYNKEIVDNDERKYAYNFDFDVIHPMMIRSFKPFFNNGKFLELGSYRGDFTERLLEQFNDITCVEASSDAVSFFKKKFGNKIEVINDTFENVNLNERFDNILLSHVLEHIDDPIFVLKKIKNEWLAKNGRVFIVCPNANAPSRQIAVKMGLITSNNSVTDAEREHGHKRTYSFETLEDHAKKSGLNIIFKSGIFFKALANFQWDQLLGTQIISDEYLEGCYQFGQIYPDLCSSIFLICE
jgi:2-polyprenyl-3-methyl-5-hydroxy-6-metoxy-1,4-benzoquinol methylase